MRRRALLGTGIGMTLLDAAADRSSPALASYYALHLALVGGVAWIWRGRGKPERLLDGVLQVGASRDAWFALRDGGELISGSGRGRGADARTLFRGAVRFAAGQSGWFAIDLQTTLWYAGSGGEPVQRTAERVVAACIGDSADYYVTSDGTLHVKGLAHRGQYGDGKLAATPGFVATANDVLDVKAHTGHAIHLKRDGVVMGTGGNRYGPLGAHGLGDKADRWGPVFDGARRIATGSRHSAAIRGDGSLWAWGEGFAIQPQRLMGGVVAVAAGDTATIALDADGALWQWESGAGPQRVPLR